jgi:multimeric flavodoxin WrbA
MKITVINGSPRKKWNTSQVLNQFMDGMRSTDSSLEIKEIHVYDYNYTGCRSCFACQMKRFEGQPKECRITDDIHNLLVEARQSNAIVLGSPIYYLDVTAQVKAFLERLMYPGYDGKPMPAAFLYTMNAPEFMYDIAVKHSVEIISSYWKMNFGATPRIINFYDTWQRDKEELYLPNGQPAEAKKIRHDEIWQSELERAFNEGANFLKEIQ